MKKLYLTLMCMVSFSVLAACAGEKKSTAPAGEETAADNVSATQDIVFEDVFDADAEGTMPSKWNIYEGTAKVGTTEGKKCLVALGEHVIVMPKVKGAEKNFLGEKYSLEFDFLFGCDASYSIAFFENDHPNDNRIWGGAQGDGYIDSDVAWIGFTQGSASWDLALSDDENNLQAEKDIEELINPVEWNHFAATYADGSMKIVINGKSIADLKGSFKPADYLVFYIQGEYFCEDEPDLSGDGTFIANVKIHN